MSAASGVSDISFAAVAVKYGSMFWMKRQRNKKKLDLSRTPGEADAPYRARILSLVGVQDGPTREAAEQVAGACLDVFASSVSHAEFVGWCGTAGHPREVHIADCRCPARLRRHFLAATQREEKALRDVIEAQRVLRTCARETARLASLLLPPKEYGPPPVSARKAESGSKAARTRRRLRSEKKPAQRRPAAAMPKASVPRLASSGPSAAAASTRRTTPSRVRAATAQTR